VYLVGWGRANHAGGGDPAVLQHVIDEDYSGQLHPTRGNSNGVDGNAHFYGVEIQYSGSQPMADIQYQAALKLSAAILDFHSRPENGDWGKDALSVIAHGEWSSDKWDPGYAPGRILAMSGVRADVKATLAAGPNQEDDVALTTDDINKIAAAVLTLDGKISIPGAPATNPTYTLASTQTEILKRIDKVAATEAAQSAAIAALAKLVGSGVDTAAVVTAVQTAIANAVIKVSVDVTSTKES
jgi:hypothetical protein